MVANHIVKLGGRFYLAGEELPEKVVPSTPKEEKPVEQVEENIAPTKRGRKKTEE